MAFHYSISISLAVVIFLVAFYEYPTIKASDDDEYDEDVNETDEDKFYKDIANKEYISEKLLNDHSPSKGTKWCDAVRYQSGMNKANLNFGKGYHLIFQTEPQEPRSVKALLCIPYNTAIRMEDYGCRFYVVPTTYTLSEFVPDAANLDVAHWEDEHISFVRRVVFNKSVANL